MFLKTLPCLGADPLLFGANRQPAVIAHPLKDRGSREKTVAVGNVHNRLRREDTRSDVLKFFVVESDRLCARIWVKHLILRSWMFCCFGPVVFAHCRAFSFALTIRLWRITCNYYL